MFSNAALGTKIILEMKRLYISIVINYRYSVENWREYNAINNSKMHKV